MADRVESRGGGDVEAQEAPAINASDESQAKQQQLQQQQQAATAMVGSGGEESSQDQSNSQAAVPARSPNKQLTESQKRDHFAIQARVDEIVAKLMSKENLTRESLSNCILTIDEIYFLINHAKMLILSQPLILRLAAGIKIFGDIHGQYIDLLRWFELFENDPENTLFLGDYVDRGRNSIETMCLLLAYKLKYPLTFFILRGNHETASINRLYGFFDEVKRRYNIKLYKHFTELFKTLPVAAIIDSKIFCCHGGLPKDLNFLETVPKVVRPFEVYQDGPICDLLWADPNRKKNGFCENDRGVSYTFGPDVFDQFLKHYDFDLMVRAHQVCEDGYEFFNSQSGVTIFSAPNYCGEFDNAGAALVVTENLECSFRILTATPRDVYRNQYVMPTLNQLKNSESLLVPPEDKNSLKTSNKDATPGQASNYKKQQ